MFSTAVLLSENLLEGYLLLALSFIISQEEPGHLVGPRSQGIETLTHGADVQGDRHTDEHGQRKHNPLTPRVHSHPMYVHASRAHMADSSIKTNRCAGTKYME